MRKLAVVMILAGIAMSAVAACRTPPTSAVLITIAPPLPAAPPLTPPPPAISAPGTQEAPPSPTTIPLPTGYAFLPQPTQPAQGYPAPLLTPPPGGYPAPLPTAAPSPTPTPLALNLPPAPTPTPAPNAISPENAAHLQPVARITPESLESHFRDMLSSPVLDVALSADETRAAVVKLDGIFVYDLAAPRVLNYIDTGSADPARAFFTDDPNVLFTSSGWYSTKLGATFFDVPTGQRTEVARVPWPAMPYLLTQAYPSPDRQMLIIQQGNAARFYDMRTLQPLITWPDRWFPATAITFSPNSHLAAISFEGVTVWDVAAGKRLFTPTPPNTSTSQNVLAAFSPDGSLLATADGATLRVWEVAPPRERFHASLGGLYAISLAFSPEGQKVAVASDQAVSVWSAQSGEQLLMTGGRAPQFSPGGARLAVQSDNPERISVWDVPASGSQPRFTLNGTQPQFMPDNRLLLQVITGTYAFADPNTGALSSTFSAQQVRVLKDGRLLDVRDDGSIRLLDPANGQPLTTLAIRARPAPATSVIYLPDSYHLVIASGNSTLRLQAPVDEDIYNLPPSNEQGAWIYQVALAPNGKVIASASKDGCLALFDSKYIYSSLLQSDECPLEGELTSIAFAPDGSRIAAGSSDGGVKLWPTDAVAIAPAKALTGHTNWVWSVAFSPDSAQIASASADKTIRVWDVASGSLLMTLTGHTEAVHSVAYSPDGSMLVSGAWDGTLKLWDARHGTLLRTLTGHTDKFNQVIFSRDGQVIASASSDGTVHLWDTATGLDIVTLNPRGGVVWGVAFSADGRQLAAALNDGTVQVWEAP